MDRIESIADALPANIDLNFSKDMSMDEIDKKIKTWIISNHPFAKMDYDALFIQAIFNNNLNLVKYLSKYNIDPYIIHLAAGYEENSNELIQTLTAIAIINQYRNPQDKFISYLKEAIASVYRPTILKAFESDNLSDDDIINKLIELTTANKQSDEIKFIILLFFYHFLKPENLQKVSKHNKVANFTFFQYFSAIVEIILLYTSILTDYYKSHSIDKKMVFIDAVAWLFDNPDNPIEKNVDKYIQSHPGLEKKLRGKSPFCDQTVVSKDQYDEILKQTYDYPKILSYIEETYVLNLIKELLVHIENNASLEIDTEYIMQLIVFHFISNQCLDNFLLA